jgi:galactitol-specific phosphotransferase system IIC component
MAEALKAARREGGGFFRRLTRALKQLFHEVTGAVFAVLAIGWSSASFRSWQRGIALWQVALGFGVAAMMLGFAVLAFRNARRVP